VEEAEEGGWRMDEEEAAEEKGIYRVWEGETGERRGGEGRPRGGLREKGGGRPGEHQTALHLGL
jgi:hypothetical protein